MEKSYVTGEYQWKRSKPNPRTRTILQPIITDNLRREGRGEFRASHYRSAANEVAVLSDKSAEEPIMKQEA